ncbi:hypothetical protein Tco_0681061, partial [Tanacetum coccineum]
MSFITIQQAKLDLELVPKEKRLKIGKCNGRLNPRKIQREPTFQVVLDALALTPCYSIFLITADIPEGQDFDELPTNEEIVSFLRELGHTGEINSLNDVVFDQMHQPWRTFAAIIYRSLSGKTTGLDKLRLSKAQILYVSWRNKIRMHTFKDDYLINTLRFVSTKEVTQIYGVVLPESLTSPEMKETKAYKTYLGFAIGATPHNKARKFKKPVSPQLSIVLVSLEEPTKKTKRVKRPAKKSTKAPAGGVVIRETPEMPLSKKKEKMTIEKCKGIDLLSEVALTEEAQYEEARKKSLRDFHKTHPKWFCVKPGVPDVTEEESFESEAESWGNDEDDNNNEQDSSGEDSDQENDSDDDKTQSDNENESDSKHEIDENKSGSESHQKENEKDIGDDEQEVKEEFVKTLSNDFDDEDEEKITDKAEEEDTNAEITNVQQGNEHPEISQVIEDAHVTLSTVPRKTEVPVTSSSHSSDLASKLLIFLEIHHTDAEIISPMDVHVHHEVPSQQTPTLLTVPVSVITESSLIFTTVILQSLPSFTLPPQQSTSIPPPTTEATNPQYALLDFALILPDEVSNFAPLVIQSMVKESLEQVVLAKESSQPQSSQEAAAMHTEFELRVEEEKTSNDAELTKGPKAKESQFGSSKGTKSQPKSFGKSIQSEEPEF